MLKIFHIQATGNKYQQKVYLLKQQQLINETKVTTV